MFWKVIEEQIWLNKSKIDQNQSCGRAFPFWPKVWAKSVLCQQSCFHILMKERIGHLGLGNGWILLIQETFFIILPIESTYFHVRLMLWSSRTLPVNINLQTRQFDRRGEVSLSKDDTAEAEPCLTGVTVGCSDHMQPRHQGSSTQRHGDTSLVLVDQSSNPGKLTIQSCFAQGDSEPEWCSYSTFWIIDSWIVADTC